MRVHGPKLIVLFALVTFLAILSAAAAEKKRLLSGELQSAWEHGDAILHTYSRLLIERGALRSNRRLDEIASNRLAMRYPDEVRWVEAP